MTVLRRVMGATGERTAFVVSMVAAAASIVAFRLRFTFGAVFALMFVATNYQSFKQHRAVDRRSPLLAGYEALVRNDLATAVSQADKVLGNSPTLDVAAAAVELKAWAAFCSPGGAAAASAALEAMPPGRGTNSFLLGSLAFDAGRRDAALDHYSRAFSAHSSDRGTSWWPTPWFAPTWSAG